MLRRFLHDRKGLSAIEFALIAPLMALLYLGLASLTLAMMAERRSGHAAAIVGDLVAQQAQAINIGILDDIIAVGRAIVSPGTPRQPGDPLVPPSLSIRITNVQADAAGAPRVVWCRTAGTGFTQTANGATPPVFSPGLILAGESIIQTELKYNYQSLANDLVPSLPAVVKFSEVQYHRPRRGRVIACSNCPAG